MELRDLRCFCVTAELQHVTRAAEKLNIAQPYLTRIIHQLEEEVGGSLFDRDGRRILLNENGKVFYRYAKKIMDTVRAMNTEMDYIFERKEQSITLLCNIESFSIRLMQAFNKQNPPYTLSMRNVTTQEIIDSLSSGSAQFALSSPPLHCLDSAGTIETVDVFHIKGRMLFPPGHPLLRKGIVNIDDIRSEKLVTMPKESGMRNRLRPIFEDNNYQPDIVFESNNLSVITQAVMQGLGVAFITDLIIEDYPEIKPYVLPLDVPDVVGYYGLSYNKSQLENKNCLHFRNFLIDFFKELQQTVDGLVSPET